MAAVAPAQYQQIGVPPPAYTPYNTGPCPTNPATPRHLPVIYHNHLSHAGTSHTHATNIVVIRQGGPRKFGNECPYCNTGFLRTDYSILGLVLAFVCFPWGLICCVAMSERRCTHCNAKC